MSDIQPCRHGQLFSCISCKNATGKHPSEAREAKRPTMYQHLRCTNDNNGNPRRVFVFYDAAGGIVAVEDEGYRGRPRECAGLVELPSIETYPAERRELLREFPTLEGIK